MYTWVGGGLDVCVCVCVCNFSFTRDSVFTPTKRFRNKNTNSSFTRTHTRTRKQRTKTTTSIFFPASLRCCFLPIKITWHLCHHACLVRRQEICAKFTKTNCIFFWGELEKICPDITIWIRQSCPMPNKAAIFFLRILSPTRPSTLLFWRSGSRPRLPVSGPYHSAAGNALLTGPIPTGGKKNIYIYE